MMPPFIKNMLLPFYYGLFYQKSLFRTRHMGAWKELFIPPVFKNHNKKQKENICPPACAGGRNAVSESRFRLSQNGGNDMFRSFFQKLKEGIGRMPVKKRVVAAGTLALGAATIIGGTGPLMAEAARTSAAGAGTALVGKSGTPGSSPFGPVAPGYILVTPMESEKSIRATSAGDSDPLMVNPDYTLLMDASEVSSAVYIPDQNHASLLFIPRMTWNNETGMAGNNSAWWLRDGSKNPGRDCSRYGAWLLRMNTGNSTSSTAGMSASQKYVLSAGDSDNDSAFNNIVFCELEEAMLKKDGKEIGSAKVGNSFEDLYPKTAKRTAVAKDEKETDDLNHKLKTFLEAEAFYRVRIRQ